jgi:hypothetical protein
MNVESRLVSIMKGIRYNWLPTISAPNISARVISAQTFHHRNISAHVRFGPVDIPAHGHFVSVDQVSVQGLFGKGTFWHKDFLAPWTFQHGDISARGHFGTVAQVPKCLCQNVLFKVPKCLGPEISSARTSMEQKIPCAKMSPCPNSLCQNVHGDKMSMKPYCRAKTLHMPKYPSDVRAETSLNKM